MRMFAGAIAAFISLSGSAIAQDAADRIDFYFGVTGIGAIDVLEIDEAPSLTATGAYAGAVLGLDFIKSGLLFGLEARLTRALWDDIEQREREYLPIVSLPPVQIVDTNSLSETWSPELAFRVGAKNGAYTIFGKAGGGLAVIETSYQQEILIPAELTPFVTFLTPSFSEDTSFNATILVGLGGQYQFGHLFFRAEAEARHIFGVSTRDFSQIRVGSTVGVSF